MICGIFHQGSGLGNQLHRYVATRVVAEDHGYGFGMVAPELFKGKDLFKNVTYLDPEVPYDITYLEKRVEPDTSKFTLWKEETDYYNPEINFIRDDTIIDGEFQDERYFEHRMDEVNHWLEVEPYHIDPNICVIGFRGGEYAGVKELFLPNSYWNKAIDLMKDIYPGIKFEVHTDDERMARRLFPYPVVQNMDKNWRAVRHARNLIIANSSFYILPALLNSNVRTVIAPRYWARYNLGYWHKPFNYYRKFTYI